MEGKKRVKGERTIEKEFLEKKIKTLTYDRLALNKAFDKTSNKRHFQQIKLGL